MTCKSLLHFSAFILFLFTLSITHLAAQEKKILLAIEDNWPPFADGHLKNGGYVTEITKKILERMGYIVELEFLPWARALSLTQSGKYAGLPGIYYSDERAKTLAFTNTITKTQQVFFKKKAKGILYSGDLQGLKPYTIGIVRGYAHSKEFDEAIQAYRLKCS